MNVLLTGGTGYIGSHCYIELMNAGCKVAIADNFANSSPAVLMRLQTITGRPVEFYEVDICDKHAMNVVFSKCEFDVVVHLAGYKAVGESIERPLMYYHNNLISTLTLCEQMKAHGVKRLVFSSSATVYASFCKPPFDENMPLDCVNPYGWTKFMNEKILTDVAATDSDWSVALLRYFNPVGAHHSGIIGENPVGIPNNLMPFITQVASGEQKELHVFGNDYVTIDGTCIRDYIHVVDLAKGHVSACKHLMEYKGVEAFNLGTGNGYSVLELIKAFERTTGVSVPYVITDRRPGDLPISYANSTKANTILGWTARKSLDDMCRDSWRWQSQNPNGF